MIVLLSGGLDSTVLTAELAAAGDWLETLSVGYGQRHSRELEAAGQVAARYRLRHDVIDLSGLAPLLTGSALTGSRPVPEGHYAEASMAATVVPNRNMILLAVAAGVASARGHQAVATAVHAGDHPVYPDCRPAFITAASLAAQLGTAGFGDIEVTAPFARLSKADIVRAGARLGTPMGLSWSCYQGGEMHCGRCGTCTERAEAFALARVPDPTRYADPAFWQSVTGGR